VENIAENRACLGAVLDGIEAAADPREEKYRLAVRLADNMRLGEAMRLLELLGDYRDCPALLEQVRAMKTYLDGVEAQLKAERSQRERDRAQREAQERRLWRIAGVVAVVIIVLAFALIK